jgi:folylpolyglutamate synthase/dihydropteroate synthase
MAETFSKLWGKRRVHVVFGLMQDKHIEHILPALEDRLSAVRFYCCTPPSPRGRRAEEVARVVETLIGVPAIATSSPEEAVELAWESAAPNGDAILCFGSFYLVAPWIKALRQHLPSHADA